MAVTAGHDVSSALANRVAPIRLDGTDSRPSGFAHDSTKLNGESNAWCAAEGLSLPGGLLHFLAEAYNPIMHYHSIWNWYLHLHPPQRIGLGIIAVVVGLALAAFVIAILSAWFYELIRGRKRGWVPLAIGAPLAIILMAAGVPLVYCIIPAYSVMFSVFVLWDMF